MNDGVSHVEIPLLNTAFLLGYEDGLDARSVVAGAAAAAVE